MGRAWGVEGRGGELGRGHSGSPEKRCQAWTSSQALQLFSPLSIKETSNTVKNFYKNLFEPNCGQLPGRNFSEKDSFVASFMQLPLGDGLQDG